MISCWIFSDWVGSDELVDGALIGCRLHLRRVSKPPMDWRSEWKRCRMSAASARQIWSSTTQRPSLKWIPSRITSQLTKCRSSASLRKRYPWLRITSCSRICVLFICYVCSGLFLVFLCASGWTHPTKKFAECGKCTTVVWPFLQKVPIR